MNSIPEILTLWENAGKSPSLLQTENCSNNSSHTCTTSRRNNSSTSNKHTSSNSNRLNSSNNIALLEQTSDTFNSITRREQNSTAVWKSLALLIADTTTSYVSNELSLLINNTY